MDRGYELRYAELTDNIKKQDIMYNIIFTILGLSCAYTTVYENIAFIIVILFISAVLLAKIQHSRNVVYYISTYLSKFEDSTQPNKKSWEYNINAFKYLVRKSRTGWKFSSKVSWFFVTIASGLKNFVNFGLTVFLAYRFLLLILDEMEIVYKTSGSFFNPQIVIACILVGVCCLLNLIFTLSICFDHSLRPAYSATWDQILAESTQESDSSKTGEFAAK